MPKARTSILLATLVLCAWFIAQGVNALLGATLSVHASTAAPRDAAIDRIARDDAHILDGNLFARTEEGPPVAPPLADSHACSGMRLVASVVDVAGPFASVSGVSGKASVLRLGDVVDDVEVTAVYPTSVSMRGADGVCQLTMFTSGTAQGTPEASVASPAPERHAPTTLSRRQALAAAEDPAQLRSARVIPARDGEGWRVFGVRRDSLPGRLGLQNGDVVRRVNGHDLAQPDALLSAYAELRSAERLVVELERGGQPTTLRYDLTE